MFLRLKETQCYFFLIISRLHFSSGLTLGAILHFSKPRKSLNESPHLLFFAQFWQTSKFLSNQVVRRRFFLIYSFFATSWHCQIFLREQKWDQTQNSEETFFYVKVASLTNSKKKLNFGLSCNLNFMATFSGQKKLPNFFWCFKINFRTISVVIKRKKNSSGLFVDLLRFIFFLPDCLKRIHWFETKEGLSTFFRWKAREKI